MARKAVYRESWTKVNGWQVRVDFLPCGGDDYDYSGRTVVNIAEIYDSVNGCKFSMDNLPAGLADAGSCKFEINYTNCNSTMKTALDTQFSGGVANLFVIWSDRGTSGGTWSVEFIGAQRVTPETKERETPTGLIIEVEAISIHKIALDEALDMSELLGFGTSIYPTLNNALTTAQHYTEFGYSTLGISTTKYLWRCETGGNLNFAPITTILAMMTACFSDKVRKHTMQATGNTYMDVDFTSALTIRLAKQNNLALYDIAARGTTLSWSDVKVLVNITRDVYATNGTYAVYLYEPALGGLFSTDADGAMADAKTYWDFFKQWCENFFIKATPKFTVTSGNLYAGWNFTSPYGTAYSVPTRTYADGDGDEPSWERNANRIGKAKIHQRIGKAGKETYEVYSQGKSDAGYELLGLFALDYMMADNVTDTYVASNAPQPGKVNIGQTQIRSRKQINTRGLFYLDAGEVYAVSPRIEMDKTMTSTYVTDPAVGSVQFMANNAAAWIQKIQEQQDAEHNFKTVAANYLALFGTGSNQTKYELDLLLDDTLVPEMIGQRQDITPSSLRSTVISEKAYAIELDITWDAKSADSDVVKATFLTRSLEYD